MSNNELKPAPGEDLDSFFLRREQAETQEVTDAIVAFIERALGTGLVTIEEVAQALSMPTRIVTAHLQQKNNRRVLMNIATYIAGFLTGYVHGLKQNTQRN